MQARCRILPLQSVKTADHRKFADGRKIWGSGLHPQNRFFRDHDRDGKMNREGRFADTPLGRDDRQATQRQGIKTYRALGFNLPMNEPKV